MTNWSDVYLPIAELNESMFAVMGIELKRWAEVHPEEYKAALEFAARMSAEWERELLHGIDGPEPKGFLG